jgi:hypothetical protein
VAEACHQQRKVVILIALHDAGADPAVLTGDHIRFVEKDRLPDPTQPVQDEAPGGLAVTKPLERNPEISYLGVAPDQAWWARASAGRVRVLVRIHASKTV